MSCKYLENHFPDESHMVLANVSVILILPAFITVSMKT